MQLPEQQAASRRHSAPASRQVSSRQKQLGYPHGALQPQFPEMQSVLESHSPPISTVPVGADVVVVTGSSVVVVVGSSVVVVGSSVVVGASVVVVAGSGVVVVVGSGVVVTGSGVVVGSGPHCPPLQSWSGPQAPQELPQPSSPQTLVPQGAAQAHLPLPVQRWPSGQVPQEPPQPSSPHCLPLHRGVQGGGTHAPPWQVAPPEQRTPQHKSPFGAHTPPVQTSHSPHRVPQAPQFRGSAWNASAGKHSPRHRIVPAAQSPRFAWAPAPVSATPASAPTRPRSIVRRVIPPAIPLVSSSNRLPSIATLPLEMATESFEAGCRSLFHVLFCALVTALAGKHFCRIPQSSGGIRVIVNAMRAHD
jgi:hypothetical protein